MGLIGEGGCPSRAACRIAGSRDPTSLAICAKRGINDDRFTRPELRADFGPLSGR